MIQSWVSVILDLRYDLVFKGADHSSIYKTHHYSLAIDKLNKALLHFPRHMGIKLNLLQVLLVSFDKNREKTEDLEQAEELIKQFSTIEPDSEFYTRFAKLNHKYILIQKSLT